VFRAALFKRGGALKKLNMVARYCCHKGCAHGTATERTFEVGLFRKRLERICFEQKVAAECAAVLRTEWDFHEDAAQHFSLADPGEERLARALRRYIVTAALTVW